MKTYSLIKANLNRVISVMLFVILCVGNIFAQSENIWDGKWLGENAQGDITVELTLSMENPNIVNPYNTNSVNSGFMTIFAIEPSGKQTILQTFELIMEKKNENKVLFIYKGGRENVDNSNGKCQAMFNDGKLSFNIISNDGDEPLFASINFVKDKSVIVKEKTNNITDIIFSVLIVLAYLGIVVHMFYVNFKGARYNRVFTLEDMKAERIAQNKPEEMSDEEYDQAVNLLDGVFETWTIVDKDDEGGDIRQPMKMKQIKASTMLLDQAIAMQPTDQEIIDRINDLAEVINNNEKRYFDGSKPLAWLGGIVGVLFCLITPSFGILTLISTGAYILASRTPAFLVQKRAKRGGGNIHNGIIAGIFGMIAGAQTVRTVYKFSDGHKEYEDDHSQHWIAWALGLVLLVFIAMLMAFWSFIRSCFDFIR